MSPEPWADARARLEALALPYPVAWPAEDFQAPDFDVWLAASGESFTAMPMEMGPGALWEERGQFVVDIFVPNGRGADEARALGKTIANAYRHYETGSPTIYRSATIGDGGPTEDAKFWQFTVILHWTFTDRVAP